jgi:spore germination protein GerM
MRTRLAVIIVSLVAVIVSCGIPDSGSVSKIPDKDVSGLNDTLPTTSTSTTAPTIETTVPIETAPVSTVAVEDVTLYFISGGLLKSYLAPPIAKNASANQILGALQAGITKDGSVGVGLRTAVPTADHPITVVEDGSGVATVDLPPDFYDQIPQEDQLLVIGQIVLTLTDIAGIGQVLFRQNGQPLGVNRGSGGLSSGTEPLARRDYDSLLNTPVTNPTTTSAVTSSLPTTVT